MRDVGLLIVIGVRALRDESDGCMVSTSSIATSFRDVSATFSIIEYQIFDTVSLIIVSRQRNGKSPIGYLLCLMLEILKQTGSKKSE